SEATRSALLDAATTLFATRGYPGTSLEDVAAAAQVTRGAVYHHFASKQALFEAVLDEQERHADEEIMAAAGSAEPWPAANLALAEAPEQDKARLRDEWAELLRRAMGGLRAR